MTVSVIIPVLNEEATIAELLRRLNDEHPHEILVADGGSTDQTRIVAAAGARVIETPCGRAVQMNRAAAAATGDVLLFLHADAIPRQGALAAIRTALADAQTVGGNFDIRYEGSDFAARSFTWINRKRREFGVVYGDSGIFCRRSVFEQLGGYREWRILEDYEFGKRLWARGRFAMLRHPIEVSARRWKKAGIWWTMWLWFWIQALYIAGVQPDRLANWYRNVR